jgi:hypothetical protein
MLVLAGSGDARSKLESAALAQASRFTWQHSAQQLLQLYQDAMSVPKESQIL